MPRGVRVRFDDQNERDNENPPDKAPETPTDEPKPSPVQDPPAEPGRPPYVVAGAIDGPPRESYYE